MKYSLLKRAAIHEAGHVLCYYLLYDNLDEIEYVEINTGEYEGNGITMFVDSVNCIPPNFNTKEGFKYWTDFFKIQVAGCCAEQICFKEDKIDQSILNGDLRIFIGDEKRIFQMVLFGVLSTRTDLTPIYELVSDSINNVKRMFSEVKNQTLINKIASTLLNEKEINDAKRILPDQIYQILREG